MADDNRLSRYTEAGQELMDAVRERAADFLRELSRASDATQRQAQDIFEELVEGGRRGTEHVLELIRTETARQVQQLSQMGFATKKELADLERRLRTERPTAAKKAPAAKRAAASKKAPAAKKAAGSKKAPTAKKAAVSKKAAGSKTAAGSKKAPARTAAAKKAPGRA